MIRRAGWTAIAVGAAIPLHSMMHLHVGAGPVVGALVMMTLAAVRPAWGLLLLAAIVPLADVTVNLLTAHAGSLRFAEAVVLAFVEGFAVRQALAGERLHVLAPLKWIAFSLAAAVTASAVVSGAVMLAEDPSASRLLPAFLARTYLVDVNPVSSAILFLEGLALLLIAADVCSRHADYRDSVLRMFVVGATGAALLNVARIVEVALRREHAWQAFREYFVLLRVNVHYGDLNAAGSFFAMAIFMCLAVATQRRPAWGAGAAAAVIAAALWLSGSRTAMMAVFLTGGVLVVVEGLRGSERAARIVAAGILAVLVGGAVGALRWYPHRANSAAAGKSVSVRLELAKVALRITATAPLFGVGVGHFYADSAEYLGPQLKRQLDAPQENAHNNYLQVLAEIGIPGLLLFLGVLFCALWAAIRGPESKQASRGLAAALVAFLLTCAGGHPLLTPAVAYAFWLAAGVSASFARVAAWRPVLQTAAVALMLFYAVSVPFRLGPAVRAADLSNVSVGLSQWQREPDGTRFRWASRRAWFFVPADATAVRIPLRYSAGGGVPLTVRIGLDGRSADEIRLPAGADWRTVRVLVPPHTTRRYIRVELEVVNRENDAAGGAPAGSGPALMVGRADLEY